MNKGPDAPSPPVSLLLLCWNHACFLEQCIKSIAEQQQAVEIVFLDNASTDGSFELAARLMDRFGLTATMLRNDRPASIPANFNRLLGASRNPVVAVLSTDDWYEPGYVDALVTAAREQPGAGWFSCSGWLYFDEEQKSLPVDESRFVTDRPVGDVILDGREPHFFVGCAYRRAALEAVGGWDEGQLIEDRDLFLRLSQRFEHHRIGRRLVHYRRNSMTASANAEFMLKGWDLFFAKHAALFGRQLRARRAETYRAYAALLVDQGKRRAALGALTRSLALRPWSALGWRTLVYLGRSMTRSSNDVRTSDVTSPLSGGAAVLNDTLESQNIIDGYAAGGVDVSRYFKDLPSVEIYQCIATGYRFFHPPSLAGEADFYEQLYDPHSREGWTDPDYREWSEDYQYAFDRIVPGERLLDVGCGYGYFLRRAAEKAEVTGIDGSRFAQEHCQKIGLAVELGSVGDYREKFANAFDTVCTFQVLEHVYDVRSFMTDLIHLAKPGGRVIVAVPNNEPYVRRFDPYHHWNCPPHHVGLWNRESLEAMAGLFGLRPIDHQYCEVSGRWVVESYLHARYILGIKSDIGSHSLRQQLMMLALAPYTVPRSLFRHWRTKGLGTRNVIVMTFKKAAAHDHLVALAEEEIAPVHRDKVVTVAGQM